MKLCTFVLQNRNGKSGHNEEPNVFCFLTTAKLIHFKVMPLALHDLYLQGYLGLQRERGGDSGYVQSFDSGKEVTELSSGK